MTQLASTSSLLLIALLCIAPTAAARPACGGKRATIVGGKGRDVIKAPKRGDQVIVALGGNDKVITHGGDDTVCSGSGADQISTGGNKDRIISGPGDDVVDSGPGSDRVDLGGGADIMFGSGGGEVTRGGSGDDRLYGEQQDDRLFGNSGDDLLVGSQGSDRLRGGAGSDWLRGDTEGDSFWGDAGEDWLSFATATPPGFSRPGMQIGNTSTVDGTPKANGDGAGESFVSVENIIGSAFADQIVATGSAQGTVNGLSDRDDYCFGFAAMTCGQDPRSGDEAVAVVDAQPRDPGLILLGGPTDDRWRLNPNGPGMTITGTTLKAGPGCSEGGPGVITCSLPGPPGYVLAYGDAGADEIQVGAGIPRQTVVKLDGGEGGDALSGGPGTELIYSGGPKNRVPFNTWRDVLDGGGGDDVIAIREERLVPAPGQADILHGGAGADQIVVGSPCNFSLMSGGAGGPDIAGFAAGSDGPIRAVVGGAVTRRFATEPCPVASLAPDLEILEGTAFEDILVGSIGSDALILGKNGDDRIFGRGGGDRIRGEDGSDVMVGGRGPDIIEARDGDRDLRVDCGPGGRRATIDSRDPRPRGCR